MKRKPSPSPNPFKATLERMVDSRLGWVMIRVPFDVSKNLGNPRQGPSQRRNSTASRFALPSSHRQGLSLHARQKSMQTGAAAAPGETRSSASNPTPQSVVAIVPVELQRILNEDRSFHRWFDEQLTFSMRKWICDWIVNVKNPASRRPPRRTSREQLFPPWKLNSTCLPSSSVAFASDPRAYRGWQSMTPLQRRHSCLASSITAPRIPRPPHRQNARRSLARAEKRDQPLALSRNSPAISFLLQSPKCSLETRARLSCAFLRFQALLSSARIPSPKKSALSG